MKAERQSEPTSGKVNAIPLRTCRRERERDAHDHTNYQGRHHVGEQVQRGDDGIESACAAHEFPAVNVKSLCCEGKRERESLSSPPALLRL